MEGTSSSSSMVFYDTETTGTNIEFDQIIQFAAILAGPDFRELDRFEIKCRRLPWVVPSPTAMLVAGLSPERLDDQSLPMFPEMMEQIRNKLAFWSPAIFIGYNSLRFDESLLARAFWQNLYPPYLTVTDGNRRSDILPLVRAVSKISAHALAIPSGNHGRPSYRLDRLAPLNGFPQRNAHDALEDVHATIYIAKRIASRSPKLWSVALDQTNKEYVLNTLRQLVPLFVMETDANGGFGWWGFCLGQDRPQSSTHLLARLECSWDSFFGLSEAEQEKFLSGYPWPVARVRLNRAPLIVDANMARTAFGIVPSKKEMEAVDVLTGRADRVPSLVRAHSRTHRKSHDATEVEQKMFEGFPSKPDEDLMHRFHSLPWTERGTLIRQFKDGRFRQLAQRLVYLMAPTTMHPSEQARVSEGIRRRLLQPVKGTPQWRTVGMAKEELNSLPVELKPPPLVKSQIMEWLDSLEADARRTRL